MLLWHEKKCSPGTKLHFKSQVLMSFTFFFCYSIVFNAHVSLLMLFPPLQTKGIQKHPTGLHVQGKAVTAMFMVICIN